MAMRIIASRHRGSGRGRAVHVGAYLKAIGATHEKPTVKQHLAAVRMLFDWLVVGQVIALNPAHSVRGPKHVVKRGKTPVLTPAEARKLLDSIDVSTVVGLRDRALIGLLAYSFARVSAAIGMRVEDYYGQGKRWWVRLHEKGGKRHEMPCHHNLEAYLDAYLEAAKIGEAKKSPLFRSARGRTGELTENPMDRVDVYRMIRRRAKDAGLDADICCHTFRATGITAYLENGGWKTLKPWRRTKVPAPQSFTIERAMRSRSMRSSALQFRRNRGAAG
jgi:integrase